MVIREQWGEYKKQQVYLWTITNATGNSVQLTNYGATVVSIIVPGKDGQKENVVIGFPTLQGYLEDTCYIGVTVGRFANRIGNATFQLNGVAYHLEANDNANSNHSGKSGFHNKVWDVEEKENGVSFFIVGEDGDGGFPGNVSVRVDYTWSNANELLIQYRGTTDKKTILNLTNHSYFNLSGGDEKSWYHELTIASDKIVETNAQYIPTGNIVAANAKAFNTQTIKEKLIEQNGRLHGLNDCYVVDPHAFEPVAYVWESASGRTMEVCTSYPGLLLYTGDYLESRVDGHAGKVYTPFDGFCLECQYFPDSPNHANFPSAVLDTDKEYNEFIQYSFGLK